MIDQDSRLGKCDNMRRGEEPQSVSSGSRSRSHHLSRREAVAEEGRISRTRWKGRLLANGKVQFVTVALMAAIFLMCLARAPLLIEAQLAWSPIQVDSQSKWMINNLVHRIRVH